MKRVEARGSTVGRWMGPVVLVLGSILVALALAEGLLRALDYSYYWALARHPHPQLGWLPPPGIRAWQRLEGAALVETNGDGLRDREWPLRKAPGVLRIAVLGDSFTEAVQVPLEQVYWRILEARLRDCERLAGLAIEVLGFGVSGYSTAQQLLLLRQRVWDYSPDEVLLAFFPGNDIKENSVRLDNDALRPHFRIQDGRLVPDTNFQTSADFRRATSATGRFRLFLLRNSRLAQAVVQAYDIYRVGGGDSAAEIPAEGPIQEPGVDLRVYGEPADSDWREAWEVTEGLIAQMHREVSVRGSRFTVVSLTTGAQVHPDPGFRTLFAARLGVSHLYYPGQRLAALGAAAGFPVLDLAPGMAFGASAAGSWLHGFGNTLAGVGHWNAEGHRLAGEIIADAICRDPRRMSGASASPPDPEARTRLTQ